MIPEPEHPTLRVELDLVVGAEPVRGHVGGALVAGAPFVGWLELIQLIDELRAPPADAAERRAEP